MGTGKYQKIIAKGELSYDDILVLNQAGKIKGVIASIIYIKHAGKEYLIKMSASAFKYISRLVVENSQ